MKRSLIAVLFGLALLVLTACAGGGQGIVVQDAWVRPAPLEGGNGAAYMVIRNNGTEDDALLSVATDIAQTVQIHETFTMAGEGDQGMGDMGDDSDMAGEMMGMRPVESIPVPAKGSATLEPGGYHVMLMGVEPLEVGQKVTLTLTFEHAGTVQVEAEVREQ